MTITEFLLARIAEDEDAARACARYVGGAYGPYSPWAPTLRPEYRQHGKRWDPSRVLAECEAKRRIVATNVTAFGRIGYPDADSLNEGARRAILYALAALALPYADHPDYDEAWKP